MFLFTRSKRGDKLLSWRSLCRKLSATVLACASIQSSAAWAQQADIRALPELPRAQATTLQPVAKSNTLATSIVRRGSLPTGASLLCPKDHSFHFYSAQVRMPLTRCDFSNLPQAELAAALKQGKRMFKLTQLPTRLASLSVNVPGWCTTSDGPWPATVTAERACVGTCAPLYTLRVENTPNLVQFSWYGGFDTHPPGFEFVGTPQLFDSIYLPCNQGPSP